MVSGSTVLFLFGTVIVVFLILGLEPEGSVLTFFLRGKGILILTAFLRVVALELSTCLWASNGKLGNIGLVVSLDVHWLSDVTTDITSKLAFFVGISEYWRT
ncbi:hypothetical protein MS3_00000742 [Schistosoma haematobium]|uniref:Uncharacterized protein n=1 Tax=Schistosoma haematobium TaxID=6185 RepID=A0A922IJB8_SCHHA|nr:hypothetical protein MS3_00000742 [Schistosoma haematobium]KAH9580866.1 hypothetical protein MS3_00000742 [Schistosoma haematobium]